MEIKIEGLIAKIQDLMNQIRKIQVDKVVFLKNKLIQDEIGLYGDQIKENEDGLRNKEIQLANFEEILRDLLRKIKDIKDQLADLFIEFDV